MTHNRLLGRPWYLAGRIAQRVRLWRLAAAAYAVACGIAPDQRHWQMRRAVALQRTDRWDEAARVYEGVLDREPDLVAGWSRLAKARIQTGDVPGAVDAYGVLMELQPAERRWAVAEAETAVEAGDWSHASTAYARLAELEPEVRKWRVEQAKALQKLSDWAGAADACNRGLAIDDTRPGDHYRLGLNYQRLDELGLAWGVYRDGLDRDPKARPIDFVMLDGTPSKFAGRRKIAYFIDDNLAAIKAAVAARPAAEPDRPGHIFVYWGQGFDEAPAVVRMCFAQLVALHDPGVVVALDNANLSEWIDIPTDVDEHASKQLTQYSDLVRSELLVRHGGIWIDATALVVEPLPPRAEDLTPSGFFAFRYRQSRIASWFLAAEAGNLVITTLLEAQYLYWRTHDKVVTYFMFHDMFEVLYALDPEFAAAVDAMPYLAPNWTLPNVMHEPYDAAALDDVLTLSFAHKLTYKLDGDPDPGSHLGHLLADGVPALSHAVAERPEGGGVEPV